MKPRSIRVVAAGSAMALVSAAGLALTAPSASAIGVAVDLGTAGSYSVLGGASVTNTGPSVLNVDVGVSPGSSISGFPPGLANGATHAADAHALQAQSDLAIAYNAAAGQAPDANIEGDIGGQTLNPGVYKGSSAIGITGPVTLDAQGDPDAVFIFQIGSTLITATSSSVNLINGAQGCNVFWQVGSSATLGTDTTFVGNILALTSISATTGTTVDGRALARNGSVTLDNNTFTGGRCATEPTSSPSTSPTSTPTGTPTTTPTVTTSPPTGTPTVTTNLPTGTPTGTSTAPTPTGTSTAPTPTGTSTAPTPTTTTPTSTETPTTPTGNPTTTPSGFTPPSTPGTPPNIPGLPTAGGEGPGGYALAHSGAGVAGQVAALTAVLAGMFLAVRVLRRQRTEG